ncbi:MAG: hypothetical protein AB8B48_05095 [Pseudomonadales bacterium]
MKSETGYISTYQDMELLGLNGIHKIIQSFLSLAAGSGFAERMAAARYFSIRRNLVTLWRH